MPNALLIAAMALWQADQQLASVCIPDQLAELLPEFLAAIRITVAARIQCPTPKPKVVIEDLQEEAPL